MTLVERPSRKTPKLGDVLEIDTPIGLAYLHFTHRHPEGKEVVRVLPGTYEARPEDIAGLAEQRDGYFVITVVRVGVREGLMRIAGHAPVPAWAQPFPIFKWDLPGGPWGPAKWRIWDGTRVRAVFVDLPPDLQRLPTRSSVMPPLLAERIARGWRPEHDCLPPPEGTRPPDYFDPPPSRDGGQASPVEGPRARTADPMRTRHYLYFATAAAARSAATALARPGTGSEVRRSERWLLLVSVPYAGPSRDEEDEERLRQLADEFGGEYDGLEHEFGQVAN